jgi:hypothetical protein
MQLVQLFVVAIIGGLTMFIFFIVFDPILNNLLMPCLDGTTCTAPAYAGIIKILFNLIGLVLTFLFFIYLLTYLNRPQQLPPTY